jgi:hypothetical protein
LGFAALLAFATGFGLAAGTDFGFATVGLAFDFGLRLDGVLGIGVDFVLGPAVGFGRGRDLDAARLRAALRRAGGAAAFAALANFLARLAAFLLSFTNFRARLSAAFAARSCCFIASA